MDVILIYRTGLGKMDLAHQFFEWPKWSRRQFLNWHSACGCPQQTLQGTNRGMPCGNRAQSQGD